MEAFKPGEHVIVELDDESMVAGYLDDYLEDGWVLRVTHKEYTIVHSVSPELAADIRYQLAAKSAGHLRLAAVFNGSLLGVVAKRYDVIEYLAGKFEEKLQGSYPNSKQLRELKSPVKTLISHGIIRTMESTTDRNISEELNGFDVDETLEDIFAAELTGGEPDGTMEEQEGERPSN
jgi:hypothetical protein